MYQSYINRPSPHMAGRGGIGRRINPRWLPNLEYFVDFDRAIPSPTIGAPGQTYYDFGNNHYNIQMNASSAQQQYQCDAFGISPWITTASGGDLSFGDSNAAPTTPTSGISMSVWGRTAGAAPGSFLCFLIRGISTNHYSIIGTSTPQVWFTANKSANNVSYQQNVPAAFFGQWRHYGYSFDGTTLNAYIDGCWVGKDGTGNGTFGAANSGKWQSPGCFTDTGNTQICSSKYPMVWHNRVLTANDFYDLYTRGPFAEGAIDSSVLGMPPPILDAIPSPATATLPYIKVRHGGTSHGATVRSVSATFTCNYDDFVVEVDTTAGDLYGYLPAWVSWLQNREFVIVNVGTHSVGMYTTDGANIGSASSVLVPAGTTKRFVAGSSKWWSL